MKSCSELRRRPRGSEAQLCAGLCVGCWRGAQLYTTLHPSEPLSCVSFRGPLINTRAAQTTCDNSRPAPTAAAMATQSSTVKMKTPSLVFYLKWNKSWMKTSLNKFCFSVFCMSWKHVFNFQWKTTQNCAALIMKACWKVNMTLYSPKKKPLRQRCVWLFWALQAASRATLHCCHDAQALTDTLC